VATPALLAQVMIAKYCDHTPLYRQSQIFARHGVDLARSTQSIDLQTAAARCMSSERA
jgi:transposase